MPWLTHRGVPPVGFCFCWHLAVAARLRSQRFAPRYGISLRALRNTLGSSQI
jgi:hypothetical protein